MTHTAMRLTRSKKWIHTAQELYAARQKRKNIQEKEQELLELLKELSRFESTYGGSFIFNCSERKGAVEYTEIPELHGIDLEEYRKNPVQCWKLTKK